MADFECPYCGADHEICHDDGFGYAEDQAHQDECGGCGKRFVFFTSISFSYEPCKADCLNGGAHQFKRRFVIPIENTRMVCGLCEESRRPTEEEMAKIVSERTALVGR